jgi:regulator of protease activity HflC (stomatin/prohibitin superfamily)
MCIPWCAVVQTSDVAAMEMCGQYRPDPLGAGCHCYLWPICDIGEFETLRLKTLNVDLNTKTVDDVFVKLTVVVNYQVNREKIYDAFYRLSNRERQMYAYTCDSLRSFICSKTLDEAFAGKGECAAYLREHLSPIFEAFGVQLVTVLVTDIVADRRVQDAMVRYVLPLLLIYCIHSNCYENDDNDECVNLSLYLVFSSHPSTNHPLVALP